MHFTRPKFVATLVLLTITSIPGVSIAVEIVRFNIEYFNSDPTPIVENHIMDVELFDDTTPLTVDNFLNYVNNGKYNESFFNRSVPGFIIQAGGFTFRPLLPTDILEPIDDTTPGGLENVALESTSPVQNEFDLTTVTNVRGTLAMAKVSHNPHSATNEWFINIADNRSNLDNQNGGFTVFGRVIDDATTFADDISELPINRFAGNVLGPDFNSLPVTGLLLGDPILQENLALIRSVNSAIVRPILRFTPSDNILPLDVVDGTGSTSLQVITLTNTGNETLTVSTIINSLNGDFIIESDNCSNVVLEPVSFVPSAACDIGIRFTASTLGVLTDSLEIDYTSSSTAYAASLTITGEGVSSVANLTINDIDLSASTVDVFFGLVAPNMVEKETLTLRNKGGTDLTISDISLTNNVEFTIDNNGCIIGTVLSLDQTCDIEVSFTHTSATVVTYDAILSITSDVNDLSIELRGIGVDPVTDVPANVDFGNIIVGQSDVMGVTVTNTGTGLILDTFVFTGTDADQFSFATNCPTTTIQTDQNCQIFVTFSPDSEGIKTASLTINSNDANSPTVIPFTGNGTLLTVPTLFSSDADIAFASADVIAGDIPTHTLSLENIGTGIITINSISIINDIDNVFSVDNAGCISGSTLNRCDITVSFEPVAGGNFSGNLVIQSDFGDLDIPLSGTGDAPIITVSVLDINLGTSQLNGLSVEKRFTIFSNGTQNLFVSDLSIIGPDSNDFTREIICTTAIPDEINLGPNKQCVIEVVLSGQSIGSKAASLVLTTNDPANPTVTFNLTGETDNDVDGIPSSTEQQALNGGDGNNDNIADDVQNNVASFTVGNNTDITMISDNASLALNTGEIINKNNGPATALLEISETAIPAEFPSNESFDLGAYNFSIKVTDDLPTGTALIFVEVAVYLPVTVNVNKYYRFGPTPDNTVPHLYDFTYNSSTGLGARSLGTVTIESATGDTIERNLVIINYLDGGLGDDDLTVNGFIENGLGGFSTGLPATNTNSSTSSMSFYYLMMFALLLQLVRLKAT